MVLNTLESKVFSAFGDRACYFRDSNKKGIVYTVKRVLYALNIHPRGPNVTPFRSTTSHVRDARFPKIRNSPNNPRITLTI